MRLLNQIVAPRRGNHLTVLCTVKLRQFTDGRAVAAEFVRVDRGWSLLPAEQRGEEVFRCFCIAMFLRKHVQHSTVLIYGTP